MKLNKTQMYHKEQDARNPEKKGIDFKYNKMPGRSNATIKKIV